jgi:hypothetical protein
MKTLQNALEQLIGKDVYVKLILEKSFNGTLDIAGADYLVLTTSARSHIIPYTAVAHIDPSSI